MESRVEVCMRAETRELQVKNVTLKCSPRNTKRDPGSLQLHPCNLSFDRVGQPPSEGFPCRKPSPFFLGGSHQGREDNFPRNRHDQACVGEENLRSELGIVCAHTSLFALTGVLMSQNTHPTRSHPSIAPN